MTNLKPRKVSGALFSSEGSALPDLISVHNMTPIRISVIRASIWIPTVVRPSVWIGTVVAVCRIVGSRSRMPDSGSHRSKDHRSRNSHRNTVPSLLGRDLFQLQDRLRLRPNPNRRPIPHPPQPPPNGVGNCWYSDCRCGQGDSCGRRDKRFSHSIGHHFLL